MVCSLGAITQHLYYKSMHLYMTKNVTKKERNEGKGSQR